MSREKWAKYASDALALISDAIAYDYKELFKQWTFERRSLPHAKLASRWATEYSPRRELQEIDLKRLLTIARYFERHEQYVEAEHQHVCTLQGAQRVYNDNDPRVLAIKSELAKEYLSLRRLDDSERLYRQCEIGCERSLRSSSEL